jgi:transcriptional regulator of met regulon
MKDKQSQYIKVAIPIEQIKFLENIRETRGLTNIQSAIRFVIGEYMIKKKEGDK